jgi:hypothetical protein
MERAIETLMTQVGKHSGIQKGEKVDFNKFVRICNSLPAHETRVVVTMYPPSNMKDFVLAIVTDIERRTERVLTQVDLLDEKWTMSLANTYDLVTSMKFKLQWNVGYTTLNLVGGDIFALQVEINNLTKLVGEYSKENYHQYRKIAGNVIPPDTIFEMP